jgi:two-component system NtrC family response regulator
VRELENIIQRALALARSPLISRSDLPDYVLGLRAESSDNGGLPEQVASLERRLIREALARAGGVQTQAARLLGISERHLRYKLRKQGLATPGVDD